MEARIAIATQVASEQPWAISFILSCLTGIFLAEKERRLLFAKRLPARRKGLTIRNDKSKRKAADPMQLTNTLQRNVERCTP